jgi:hypothetical protein
MTTTDFDRLTIALAAATSRRRIGRLLAAWPLAAAFAVVRDAASDGAGRRHRRHLRDRRAERGAPLQAQRKKKHQKKCARAGQTTGKKRKKCCKGLVLVKDGSGRCAQPASDCLPATCAPNACGSVPDGCGGTRSCGGCAGNALCVGGICQPCHVCASGCIFTTVQDAVDFALPGATIRLCAGLYAGDIVIDKRLTLIGAGDGPGAGNTILDGSGTGIVVRIEDIGDGVQRVALERLRITGGNAEFVGGGIHNQGALELTDCTVSGNTAASGGGITNSIGGTITLTGCTVSGNSAAEIHGGGITNIIGGTMTLINSVVTGNTAGIRGGGISSAGTVELINSVVTGNTAGDAGGGIHTAGGTVTLDAASRVTANQADSDGDAGQQPGGGIYNEGGTVMLASSANVSGNAPDNCGGPTPVPLCVG